MKPSAGDIRLAERGAVAWLAWFDVLEGVNAFAANTAAFTVDREETECALDALCNVVLPGLHTVFGTPRWIRPSDCGFAELVSGFLRPDRKPSTPEPDSECRIVADAALAGRCEAVAWLEWFVLAFEDGRLIPSTTQSDSEREQLLGEVWTLRGIVLPTLHEVFDIEPWTSLRALDASPDAT